MGDPVDVLALERKSVQPYSSQDEYLWAMREDLADWFNKLYDLDIIAETFFERLETGVILCQHANNVQSFILQRLRENGNQWKHSQREASLLKRFEESKKGVQYRENVRPGTFQSRDNVSNFISWCRGLGLPDCLLFETNDLVDLLNERSVILCLLEVARQGAKYGMEAPMLVQLEKEIDAEIAGEQPAPEPRQRILNDHRSLDEMVRDLVSRCTCPDEFPMIRVSEGKYKIGDSQTLIFVRILRKHVMVRIGGGWDTLENYLDRHDPCRCDAKGQHGSKKNAVSPMKMRSELKKTPARIDSGLSSRPRQDPNPKKDLDPPSGRASPQLMKNAKTDVRSDVKTDTRRAMTPTKELRRSNEGSLRPSTPNNHSRQNSTSDLSQCSDDSIPSVHSLNSLRGGRNVSSKTTTNGNLNVSKGVSRNHSRSRSVEPSEYRPNSPKISPANSIKQNKKNGEVFMISRDSGGKHSFKSVNANGEPVHTNMNINREEGRRTPVFDKNSKEDGRRTPILDKKILPDKPKVTVVRTASNETNDSSDKDDSADTEIAEGVDSEGDWGNQVFLSTLPYENLPEPQPDEHLHAQMEMLFEQLRQNELRRMSSSDETDGARRNGRRTPERGDGGVRATGRKGRPAPLPQRRRTSSTSSATLSPSPGTNVNQLNFIPNSKSTPSHLTTPNKPRPRHQSAVRDTREPRQLSVNNRARSVSPSRSRQAMLSTPLNFNKTSAKKRMEAKKTGTRTAPSTPTSTRRALTMTTKQLSEDDLLNDALNMTYPLSSKTPLRECHDKGAQTINLPSIETTTPRRDDKHFGRRTRIPQPVKYGDKGSQMLKRYDSGVDINNVSPNDINGRHSWPDDEDEMFY